MRCYIRFISIGIDEIWISTNHKIHEIDIIPKDEGHDKNTKNIKTSVSSCGAFAETIL